MKFKVISNIRLNMYQKLSGSITLVCEDGCPRDFDWLIDEVMKAVYEPVNDKSKVLKRETVKKSLLKSMFELEVDNGLSVNNFKGQVTILIKRVSDDITFSDILVSELP